ncbi:MAG: hypothetical protein HY799_02140 [Nitrosomonadales bacterium]|nr:hypothetical protein [Nitrosomonadales bacterium]
MIDLLSITDDIPHKPFGSVRKKETEDGEVKTKQFTKTLYINHVPVFVTSLNNGTQINIRCCPLKIFQGHNVFGTNSLMKLSTRLIVEVLRQLEIKPSKAQLRNWMRGEFQVDELHVTNRFLVSKYPMVRKVIFHIKRYSSETLCPSSLRKGIGVTLKAPHGKAVWLFYDKRQEFSDKRTKEQKYLRAVIGDGAEHVKDLLLRLASKSVRAELKLSKRYLRAHGLDRGKAWAANTATEVFVRELELLGLGKIPALPELPKLYTEIEDPKLRSIVILWAHGEDMTEHYAPSTVRKFRKAVMDQLGIDILKDQPALESASVNLSDIFAPCKMLTGFPKWARKYPELALR